MKRPFSNKYRIRAVILSAAIFLFNTSCLANNKFPSADFIVPPKISHLQRNEAVQGQSDFEKIRDLDVRSKDFDIARRVGHFVIKNSGVCSGFLVGPDLFMTNHHCVFDDATRSYYAPEEFSVHMDYIYDKDLGNISSTVKKIEIQDEYLDFALLRLRSPLGKRLGWLPLLQTGQKTAYKDAKIIQHPHGRSKEISRKNSKFTSKEKDVVHYLADTQGGSSGSPVFTKNGSVVIALHHAGVANHYNEGIRMDVIWPHISPYLYESTSQQVDSSEQRDKPSQKKNMRPVNMDTDTLNHQKNETNNTMPSGMQDFLNKQPSGLQDFLNE